MDRRSGPDQRRVTQTSSMLPPTRKQDNSNRQHDLGVTMKPVTYLSGGRAVQSSSRRRSSRLPSDSTPGDDYVSRWLAQTLNKEKRPQETTHAQRESLEDFHPGHAQRARLQQVFNPFSHGNGNDASIPTAHDNYHEHSSSSGSSFLELGFLDSHLSSGRAMRFPNHDEDQVPHTPGQKRRRQASECSRPEAGVRMTKYSPAEEKFERRKRHKTREDRYKVHDPRREGVSEVEIGRPTRKRIERGARRQTLQKAGEELIQSFTSDKLGQERLTFRPSHGLGLFQKGKASSAFPRHGLPDLAFSEMDFLRHSRQRSSDLPRDRHNSKSREKEKRKTERAHHEISAFFSGKKEPPQEVIHNRAHDRTPLNLGISPENRVRSKTLTSVNSLRRSMYSNSASMSLGTSPKLKKIFEGRAMNQEELAPRYFHDGDRPAFNAAFGKTETECSWSDTVYSLGESLVNRQTQNLRRKRRSSTPSSIRKSLEESGVFHGTGIRKRSHRTVVSPSTRPKDGHRRISGSSSLYGAPNKLPIKSQNELRLEEDCRLKGPPKSKTLIENIRPNSNMTVNEPNPPQPSGASVEQIVKNRRQVVAQSAYLRPLSMISNAPGLSPEVGQKAAPTRRPESTIEVDFDGTSHRSHVTRISLEMKSIGEEGPLLREADASQEKISNTMSEQKNSLQKQPPCVQSSTQEEPLRDTLAGVAVETATIQLNEEQISATEELTTADMFGGSLLPREGSHVHDFVGRSIPAEQLSLLFVGESLHDERLTGYSGQDVMSLEDPSIALDVQSENGQESMYLNPMDDIEYRECHHWEEHPLRSWRDQMRRSNVGSHTYHVGQYSDQMNSPWAHQRHPYPVIYSGASTHYPSDMAPVFDPYIHEYDNITRQHEYHIPNLPQTRRQITEPHFALRQARQEPSDMQGFWRPNIQY